MLDRGNYRRLQVAKRTGSVVAAVCGICRFAFFPRQSIPYTGSVNKDFLRGAVDLGREGILEILRGMGRRIPDGEIMYLDI